MCKCVFALAYAFSAVVISYQGHLIGHQGIVVAAVAFAAQRLTRAVSLIYLVGSFYPRKRKRKKRHN